MENDLESTVATEKRLDIFKVLGAADGKQETFFEKLTDDERKELQPFLVARWMSGTFDAAQVYFINEFVNPYTFSLTSHKYLLWQLLTVANSGKQKRYAWNKLPSKRETGKPNAIRLVREYFGYSTADAVDALDILSRDQVLHIAEQLGRQAEDITKIRRELKLDKQTDDNTESAPPKKNDSADTLIVY